MANNPNDNSLSDLERAILNLHNCKSKWVESIPIKEMFGDRVVWKGIVQVFDLIDHPTSKQCYAWSHAIEGSKKRKYHAVLHTGPVDSPAKAVRASIIAESKK